MGFLDYFTSIDELLKEVIQNQLSVGAKLDALITALTGELPETEIPGSYLPFVDEVTLKTAQPTELLISADADQGLGVPAKSGNIINDGAGEVWFSIHDGITGYSNEFHLYDGEYAGFAHEDRVLIDKLMLRTDTDDTVVRVLLTR